MDSKLPKPSGLKRPMTVVKNILPMDRIGKGFIGRFGGQTSSTSMLNQTQPLTTDLLNLPNGIRLRGDRAASPEMIRGSALSARARLRRSRSACDIRDVRAVKRTEITLAPIPAKSSRLMTNVAPSSSSSSTSTSSNGSNTNKASGPAMRTTRFPSAPASTVSALASKRQLVTARLAVQRAGISAAAAALVSKKPATATATTTTTSISTTGAGKPIHKRIPPYDFKARYNDLLEKHKVLKEKYESKCEEIGGLENMPEQLEESQAQLYTTQEELKNARTDNECLNRQVKSQTMKIDSISSCLVKTTEALDQLKTLYHKTKEEHEQLSTEVAELRERNENLMKKEEYLSSELEVCKEQLFRSNIERKELHNTIMDLRGNIRVFCRVRPPLDCEQSKMLCGWNYLDEATVEIQNHDGLNKNKAVAYTFSFDHVFHPASTQDNIFEMVSPLIQSALDGYNICIFAYGQTGSGKTYTMDGIPTQAGVIPRTVDLLFDAVRNYKRLGWEYEIKATFLEIYNEVLYDLLSNEQKDMDIRISKNNRNDIYVSNITEETVVSAARLRELMGIAKMNRATASTAGNERSSRSHAVTKIELIGTHAEKNETCVGTINLVDLAGSESPKTSTRMNETKNINRSLSELTNVILALLQKQDHIPYRNSKLTHLLMPSLGGNSKTLMFINVSPFVDCFVESVKSLRFAASVNSCKMAKAKRNRFLNTSSSASFEK